MKSAALAKEKIRNLLKSAVRGGVKGPYLPAFTF